MAGDDDYCYLTTRGRVTGNDHEIEIWYARDGDTLYLLAGAGDGSDWVRNLQAEPRVTVRMGAVTHAGRGRVIGDPAEDKRARTLVFDKYQPRYASDLERWREASLPVALDLMRDAAADR